MKKFEENCKISKKFGISRQILDKIYVKKCEKILSGS